MKNQKGGKQEKQRDPCPVGSQPQGERCPLGVNLVDSEDVNSQENPLSSPVALGWLSY